MRSVFLASVAPLLLLILGACGSSSAGEPAQQNHFASDDAGEGGAAPEGGSAFVDADADALTAPLCASVPTGPTGTVTAQGSPGFAIVGGGAWSQTSSLPDGDGGLEPARSLFISLSDQVNACVANAGFDTGVTKVNAHALTFDLVVPGDQPPPPGTYMLAVGGGSSPALTINTAVQTSCTASTGTTVQDSTHSLLTLTEVAADHVKGTYSVMLDSQVTGTFDLPICPQVQIPQPCCVP